MDLANSISAMATVASDKQKMLETSFAELEKSKGKLEIYAEKKSQYFKAVEDVAIAEQNLKFAQVRAESRLIWIRNEYLKAFKAGKEYPFGNSFEHYKKNKELQNANRMWIRGDPKYRDAQ